jgi:hypothetical protein
MNETENVLPGFREPTISNKYSLWTCVTSGSGKVSRIQTKCLGATDRTGGVGMRWCGPHKNGGCRKGPFRTQACTQQNLCRSFLRVSDVLLGPCQSPCLEFNLDYSSLGCPPGRIPAFLLTLTSLLTSESIKKKKENKKTSF